MESVPRLEDIAGSRENGKIYRETKNDLKITCDQALFFSGEHESVAARESAVGEKNEKKERLIQLLHKLSAAPCLLMRCYLVSCF